MDNILQYIAAGTAGGMLRIWNVRTSQLVEKWSAHWNAVRSLVFTPDGKGLISCSRDGTWKCWDISFLEQSEPGYGMTKGSMTGRKIKVMANTVRPSQCSCSTIPSQYLALLQNGVHSIAISSDGQWIVSGSGDRTVRIWDLHNAALQCTLKGNKDVVWSVDSCRTGNYLASGSEDGRVALWRYEAA